MGQHITVTQAPSAHDNTRIYTLDRSLTGMEILNFNSEDEIGDSDNPAFVCAKRILEKGVDTVSIYSNVVTVGADADVLEKNHKDMVNIMETLYIYYGDNAGWAPGSH